MPRFRSLSNPRRTYEGFERQYRSYGRGTTLSVAAYQHVGLRITAAQYVARVAHWLAHSPQARQNPWIRRRTERYLEGCHETLEVIQRDGIAPLPRSVFTEAIR